MIEITKIKERFKKNFPANQADALAESFWEAYASNERLFDEMSELRGEVKKLTEAQLRTEQRVDDLAKAQNDLARAQNDLTKAQKNTEKEIKNLARQVGGLSEKMGGSLEDLAYETVPAVLESEWDMEITEIEKGFFITGDEELEMDLVVKGVLPGDKPITVLTEVKSNLTIKEVDNFFSKIGGLKNKLEDSVRILFFGFKVNRDARNKIKENGAYMLFSNGRFLK